MRACGRAVARVQSLLLAVPHPDSEEDLFMVVLCAGVGVGVVVGGGGGGWSVGLG